MGGRAIGVAVGVEFCDTEGPYWFVFDSQSHNSSFCLIKRLSVLANRNIDLLLIAKNPIRFSDVPYFSNCADIVYLSVICVAV